ncbi:MAG TPA: hypothetical protein VNA12_01430 [Mycobacteriales bacterium]|nr:hypothetical protein [Mycobacteriales bacterium]
MKTGVLVVASAMLATSIPAVGHGEEPRRMHHARILASVPAGDRGYIEGIAYDGTDVYAGTGFGSTGTGAPLTNRGEASRIFSWNRVTGVPTGTIVLGGEDTSVEHGITGIKFDAQGRLYALSNQLGLVRFTRNRDKKWHQENLVQLPDLAPCAVSTAPCSPTLTDRRGLGNDLTWGPDGRLYISDSFQSTIWKVTLGKARPTIEPWFQSAAFDRVFGANGLRVGPGGRFMAVAITGPDTATVGPIDRASRVIAVPFPDPSAGKVTDLLVLPNDATTDGLAYGARGDLYVLSNNANRIYIRRSSGAVEVVTNDDLTGGGKMDFPASLAFDRKGALLICNYAWFDGQTPLGSRSVIDVWVNDVGLAEPPTVRAQRGRTKGASL